MSMNVARLLIFLVACTATSLRADDAKPLLVLPGKLVVDLDLRQPLGPGWTVKHGTWELKDGELVIAEVPAGGWLSAEPA